MSCKLWPANWKLTSCKQPQIQAQTHLKGIVWACAKHNVLSLVLLMLCHGSSAPHGQGYRTVWQMTTCSPIIPALRCAAWNPTLNLQLQADDDAKTDRLLRRVQEPI